MPLANQRFARGDDRCFRLRRMPRRNCLFPRGASGTACTMGGSSAGATAGSTMAIGGSSSTSATSAKSVSVTGATGSSSCGTSFSARRLADPSAGRRRFNTSTRPIGVSMRSGAASSDRSSARCSSGGLTRRTRTGVFEAASRRVMAAGESEMRWFESIGPRCSRRTRIVRPVSSEVTST